MCTCGDKDCPLLYDGYMSDECVCYHIPGEKRPEFGRTCKNNKSIQYYVEDEIMVRKRDRGTTLTFKLDEVEFGNPEIETIMINKIKNFINIA